MLKREKCGFWLVMISNAPKMLPKTKSASGQRTFSVSSLVGSSTVVPLLKCYLWGSKRFHRYAAVGHLIKPCTRPQLLISCVLCLASQKMECFERCCSSNHIDSPISTHAAENMISGTRSPSRRCPSLCNTHGFVYLAVFMVLGRTFFFFHVDQM